jgi:hypothetical protein
LRERTGNQKRLEGEIRHKVAQIGQSELASRTPWEKSNISRIVGCDVGITIDNLEVFFNALGLEVISIEEVEALRLFARKHLGDSVE